MAFAVKYRPKKLSDLIGQEVIVKTLSNAIQNDQLHHAYLFVGQYGSGKTTAARILAAMENCETSPGITPCGECGICNDIFHGRHSDIEEIDAASTGKVEQIRELKTSALYLPIDGARKKYYIIDEFHSVSSAGAEALLKLIEEPPPHVRFILCTTELDKVKGTIRSRCQVHEFKKIYWRLIAKQLEEIAKKENLEAENSVLSLCSRLANGSMRSALQNLEKVSSFSGNGKVTTEDAEKVFSTVSEMTYYDLIDEVVGVNKEKVDATGGFKIINTMLQTGANFAAIYNGITEKLNDVLICLTSSKAGEFVNVSEEGKRRLKEQATFCKDKIKAILDSLNYLHEASQAVEYNLSPETALQKWFIESLYCFNTGK